MTDGFGRAHGHPGYNTGRMDESRKAVKAGLQINNKVRDGMRHAAMLCVFS